MTCSQCQQPMTALRLDLDLTSARPALYWTARRHGFEPRFAPPNVAICDTCERADVLGEPLPPVEPPPRSLIGRLLLQQLVGGDGLAPYNRSR